jgi:uncharacterized protein (DUF2147 family)
MSLNTRAGFLCLSAFAIAASLSAANAQSFPDGCWKIPDNDGGSVNAIFKCRGDKLCSEVAVAAGGGKEPTQQNVGRCIISAAAKNGAVWKGEIYVFALGKTVSMELKTNGSASVNVKGCYAGFCQARDWTKATCPAQRPAHPEKCK